MSRFLDWMVYIFLASFVAAYVTLLGLFLLAAGKVGMQGVA